MIFRVYKAYRYRRVRRTQDNVTVTAHSTLPTSSTVPRTNSPLKYYLFVCCSTVSTTTLLLLAPETCSWKSGLSDKMARLKKVSIHTPTTGIAWRKAPVTYHIVRMRWDSSVLLPQWKRFVNLSFWNGRFGFTKAKFSIEMECSTGPCKKKCYS